MLYLRMPETTTLWLQMGSFLTERFLAWKFTVKYWLTLTLELFNDELSSKRPPLVHEKNGRLREVVAYGRINKINPKLNRLTNYITLLPYELKLQANRQRYSPALKLMYSWFMQHAPFVEHMANRNFSSITVKSFIRGYLGFQGMMSNVVWSINHFYEKLNFSDIWVMIF